MRIRHTLIFRRDINMKVAAITDDGETISMHFGRARYFKVFTVEDGKIKASEMRDKMGHHDFASHGHESTDDPRGHGFSAGAAGRHTSMMGAITDCEALIVRGMGRGAYIALEEANIKPVVTDIERIEEAVQAYIDGTIVDHSEWLH
jgi:predicted Fe-Mo cluster-binding NifX family protein